MYWVGAERTIVDEFDTKMESMTMKAPCKRQTLVVVFVEACGSSSI